MPIEKLCVWYYNHTYFCLNQSRIKTWSLWTQTKEDVRPVAASWDLISFSWTTEFRAGSKHYLNTVVDVFIDSSNSTTASSRIEQRSLNSEFQQDVPLDAFTRNMNEDYFFESQRAKNRLCMLLVSNYDTAIELHLQHSVLHCCASLDDIKT